MDLALIADALRDVDGACRDVNFDAPTWRGVGRLMASLLDAYRLRSATDHRGANLLTDALCAGNGPYDFWAYLDGGRDLITELQVFTTADEDGRPHVELSFFPRDVDSRATLGTDFVRWAEHVRDLLEARRCYARYENASWRHGDCEGRDVFLVLPPVQRGSTRPDG